MHTTIEIALLVIKPSPATLSAARPRRSTAINGSEMKVYEIIDAGLKGRQLCEIQGGFRKGLLIRTVWSGMSVKRRRRDPVNRALYSERVVR